MSDPTADAAKLLPVPSTDPIKDCPRCGGTHVGTPGWCPITQEPPPGWEPCPQPAPPAGEPDFAGLADELWTAIKAWQHCCEPIAQNIARFLRCRLGLSARPKVEDAELTEVIDRCRRYGAGQPGQMAPWPEMTQAADLLERLAVELATLKQDYGRVTMELVDIDVAKQAAEAKLAEREAELAKSDAVIVWAFEKLEPGQHGISHGRFESDACVPTNATQYHVIELANERHAARQQQKAPAEPAEKEGE